MFLCMCVCVCIYKPASEFKCPIACQGVVHSTDIQVRRFHARNKFGSNLSLMIEEKLAKLPN